MDAEWRIEQLGNEIDYHNGRYFVLNDPTIPDLEHDQLMKELIAVEQGIQNYALLTPLHEE